MQKSNKSTGANKVLAQIIPEYSKLSLREKLALLISLQA